MKTARHCAAPLSVAAAGRLTPAFF